MQTEAMKRLIKDEEIVGWMLIKDGIVYYQPRCDLFQPIQEFRDTTRIEFDSFEQGIKQDDGTWWFSGDEFLLAKDVLRLSYEGGDGWELYDKDGLYVDGLPELIVLLKYSGNIHDKEE
ncbi:MAG TPA: hypothetical protein ENH82_06735 [bacterium]|nr:hypothetical protein [bacterium]